MSEPTKIKITLSEFQKQVTQTLPGEWDVQELNNIEMDAVWEEGGSKLSVSYWQKHEQWGIGLSTRFFHPDVLGVDFPGVIVCFYGIGDTLAEAKKDLSFVTAVQYQADD